VIDQKRELIYLHPSKTGGTSIEAAFLNDLIGGGGSRKAAASLLFLYSGQSNQHWPLQKFIEVLPFTKDWRKVASVRHPYTRVISEFRYQLMGHRLKSQHICYKNKNIDLAIKSGQIWDNSYTYHNTPQHKYVAEGVELIRFENLEDDFKRLTGLSELPHTQKGSDFHPELSEQSKEIIYKRYKKDFDVLGYQP